jgi:hypothetical protein
MIGPQPVRQQQADVVTEAKILQGVEETCI